MTNLIPVAFTNVTADVLVKTGPGSLVSVLLTAAGDTATVILYDNTSAGGTKLCTLSAVTLTSAQWTPTNPQVVSLGIFADVSGTTPQVTVVYT